MTDIAATQAVKVRPPHPGELKWVDVTPQVRKLAEAGNTVEDIAKAVGVTRGEIQGFLDHHGYRRFHNPPRKTGRRTFDREAVRAAHDAGESRADIAARLGISVASVSLAVNEARS